MPKPRMRLLRRVPLVAVRRSHEDDVGMRTGLIVQRVVRAGHVAGKEFSDRRWRHVMQVRVADRAAARDAAGIGGDAEGKTKRTLHDKESCFHVKLMFACCGSAIRTAYRVGVVHRIVIVPHLTLLPEKTKAKQTTATRAANSHASIEKDFLAAQRTTSITAATLARGAAPCLMRRSRGCKSGTLPPPGPATLARRPLPWGYRLRRPPARWPARTWCITTLSRRATPSSAS